MADDAQANWANAMGDAPFGAPDGQCGAESAPQATHNRDSVVR